jgi:hypothetical protein
VVGYDDVADLCLDDGDAVRAVYCHVRRKRMAGGPMVHIVERSAGEMLAPVVRHLNLDRAGGAGYQ